MKRKLTTDSRWLLVSIFVCLALLGCGLIGDDKPDYWPTDEWRTATPESQGMDSSLLLNMLDVIWQRDVGINSVLIVRNGYIVMEAYGYPLAARYTRNIFSCSKSVTSALVGIAIDKGYIKDVNQPVLDFFPRYTAANLNDAKKTMHLRHLLTMTAGLETKVNWRHGWSGLNEMKYSSDWIQYVLDLPMTETPGTRFEYSNCVTFLISAILQEKTGMTALEFAKQHLFEPLGIRKYSWPSNFQGTTLGYSRLRLRPRDMAKFGFLYLHKGMWEDKQIISSRWVEESTRKQVDARGFPGYGYQWWTADTGSYIAIGYGGQFIYIIPDKKLIAVFTGSLKAEDMTIPTGMLYSNIIPAVKSDRALPDNPEKEAALQDLAALLQKTKPVDREKIRARTARAYPNLLPGEYINTEYGFTAKYDPKLVVEDQNLEPGVIFRRKGIRGLPVFGVAIDDIPEGLMLKDSGQFLIDMYRKVTQIKDPVLSGQELITLADGTPANYVEVTWTYRWFGMQTVAVIAYKEDKIIGVGVIGNEQMPKDYLAGMAKSLTFEK
jgi:CubicO group peptidase (beta-lactamase class C family)